MYPRRYALQSNLLSRGIRASDPLTRWALKAPSEHVPQLRSITTYLDRDGTQSPDTSETATKTQRHSRPSKPYTRRPLAVSPLLDPSWQAARQKHQQPKEAPTNTDLQQQLAKNPYAQALASPIRRCIATSTLLPSFFLQDFSYIAHPTTRQPWLLPRSLTANPTQTETIGPKAYVLSRAQLLNDKKLLKVPRLLRAVAPGNGSGKGIGFREDVGALVLRLMRKRVVEGLIYLAESKNGRSTYLSRCDTGDDEGSDVWESVKRKNQVGALLWLGYARPQNDTAPASTVPGEFATLDLPKDIKTKIPVYNLQHLLGEVDVEILKEKVPETFGDVQLVAVKAKSVTKDIQMRLWKLQGFLARFDEFGKDEMSGKRRMGEEQENEEDD